MLQPAIEAAPQIDHIEMAAGAPRASDVRRTSSFVFVVLVGFYLFALLLAASGAGFFRDPDVYWHVAAGLKIWRSWSLPHVDELSHTFRGHPWIAKEWLAQLLLSGAYAMGSWRGVALLNAATVALTYGLLFLALARRMRIAIGVATVAWGFSAGHFNGRPQIFADPLIVIWIAALIEAVETGKPPSLFLLPVMTLWANLHASFTFGLAIAAWLAIEAIFRSSAEVRRETFRRWALFLVAALACACLTPYGYQPILMTFNVFIGNDAVNSVQEWRPVTLNAFDINGLTLFALLFLALLTGAKFPIWRLAPLIALVDLMFSHIRFAALFAIVAPLLLVAPLVKQFPRLGLAGQFEPQPRALERTAQVASRLLYPTAAAILAGALAFSTLAAPIAPAARITPEGAVDALYRTGLTGNLYNDFNFGGYLIFRGVPTFIDGRNDQLFLNGFVTRLLDVINRHPREFETYLAQHDVSIALLRPDTLEAQELERSAQWEKVYSDSVSELFRKHSP